MKTIELEFQGRRVRVPALKHQGQLWFHWQGETHVLDLNAGQRRGRSEKGSGQPGVCNAPMPGKITKLAVQAGDQVQVGQTLVVMEAMKMEYTLAADIAGQVQEVKVALGQQVALGALLVQVVKA
jgi:acetyl/propionyl-CoA carboxylase alpha subunit